jgi:flagellar biosynthesis protein FlhF
MSTQVFRARTLEEARRAATAALGDDLVVVMTRKVRRAGIAGLLGSSEFELVAERPEALAATGTDAPKVPVKARNNIFAQGVYEAAPSAAPSSENASAKERSSRIVPRADVRAKLPPRKNTAAPTPPKPRAEEDPYGPIHEEIRQLRERLTSSAVPVVPPSVLAELAAMRDAVEQLTPAPKKSDRLSAMLRARGIEGTAATALQKTLRDKSSEDAPALEVLRESIAEVVRVAAWPLANEGRRVIGLVGPTGVGKTTTAAKLAAHARRDGRSVTFVACDLHRVGAVDQLRRYADLIGARFFTASNRNELLTAIEAAGTDVVIVDTAGRMPRMDGLEATLTAESFSKHPETKGYARHVLLCVPASMRAGDAARIVRSYGPLSPTAIAVTKIDETDTPAGIVHAAAAAKRPVSVLCFGQRVPEDIAPATSAAVLDHVAPRTSNTVMAS